MGCIGLLKGCLLILLNLCNAGLLLMAMGNRGGVRCRRDIGPLIDLLLSGSVTILLGDSIARYLYRIFYLRI